MARSPAPQFKPANRCIYCGDRNEPLSREHIIPYGLNGNFTLKNASCDNCANITKRFEEEYLRGPIWAVRSLLKFTSRRPAPETIPLNVGSTQVLIPPYDYPAVLILPALDTPGIMQNLQPGCEIRCNYWTRVFQVDAAKLRKYGVLEAWSTPTYLPNLARNLAKIAHAYAAAELGVDGFEPFLLDIILNGSEKPWFLVGGYLDIPPAAEKGSLHSVELLSYTVEDMPDLLVAEIRLFAEYGAPVFRVVVGSRR